MIRKALTLTRDLIRSRVFQLCALVMAIGCAATYMQGCAKNGSGGDMGGADEETVRNIVAIGGVLALDIDAAINDGTTEQERANLQQSTARAMELVGVDSATGQELARLIAAFTATGGIDEVSWRAVVRELIYWASTPPAATEPAPGMFRAVSTVHSSANGLVVLVAEDGWIIVKGQAWDGWACNSPGERQGCVAPVWLPVRAGQRWLFGQGVTVVPASWRGNRATAYTWGGPADIDLDGDVGTDADIEAFWTHVAWGSPGADFDGNGDIGTDADIERFYRVLGGG
jgi:hypothetical protein